MKNKIQECFEFMIKIDFLYDKLARMHGTTDATVKILIFLEHNDNVSQKDISEQLVMPKQTVNNILSNFKKSDYIELQNIEGKKNKIIKITAKGNEYFSKLLNNIYEVEKNIFNEIGENNFESLTNNLEKYYLALKREVKVNE